MTMADLKRIPHIARTAGNFDSHHKEELARWRSYQRRRPPRCSRLIKPYININLRVVPLIFALVGALFQLALHVDISSTNKPTIIFHHPDCDDHGHGHGHGTDPPLETIQNKDGIAMCLLIKDDNEKLPEWLAYHFLEMPLQYLIVGVDPFSTTSPEKILNIWRKETGMDIVLWHDPHYRHVDDQKPSKENEYLPYHRRQEHFIAECIRHHKARGRKWLTIIDTDEFITNNVIFGNDERQNVVARNASDTWKLQEWEKKYVLKPNQTLFDYTKKFSSNKPQAVANRTVLENMSPDTSTRSTKVEGRMHDPFAMENFMDKACHLIPRITMTSVEEEDLNILHRHMPRENNDNYNDDSSISDQNLCARATPNINSAHPNTNTNKTSSHFDPMRFNTLRFFYHANPSSKRKIVNGYGKVIIDLDRVRYDEIITESTHRPLRDVCACMFPEPDFRNKQLMIHHYMGTWEQYNAKDDSLRSRRKFNKKALHQHGKTHHLQGWLKRFVEKVGVERSRLLLEGAGVLDIGTNKTMVKDLADYPMHDAFETRHGVEIYGNSSHPEDLPYFGINGELVRIPKQQQP